ncbi:MAG: hypothetical protein KAJ18_00395, partial [Candidatus Omnitrophica bacterium]|nr:hypothetical protein [Candidatus Omnitrophota bacterium]
MRNKFLLLMVVVIFVGCGGKDTGPKRLKSPKGKYRLGISVNKDNSDMRTYLCIKIHLFDSLGKKELSVVQTRTSERLQWVAGWVEKKDIIVFYGVGEGTRAWEINEERKMQEIESTKRFLERVKQLKQ